MENGSAAIVVIFFSYLVCNFFSEDRAAACLLATAQHNRTRPLPPTPPQLPDSMMSKERAIKVNLLLCD